MLEAQQKEQIRAAFREGTLRIRSMSPSGVVAWKRILDVSRAEVGSESILEVTTSQGNAVLTGGHRVFMTPTDKLEACELRSGHRVEGGVEVTGVKVLPNRQHMYDLTAEDWHNFFLVRSGMLVSNSPDRNYHFRPPAHEETVQQFSRVFGYIWEDVELQEYILRSLDMISAAPPRTPFGSVDQMVQFRPEWRTLLLTGAMVHALQALRINWVADEFNYSIGGVSLDLEKSSKYEGAYQAASDQFDKQLEKGKATINVVKGLQQPRFGMGIRSAFGPYVGAGVLSPRKFVGFVFPFLLFLQDYLAHSLVS